MKKWHIKELSDITNVSIRMLRHYDKIGLLKPSYREANGYRCYTEPDLAKLEQIIALKYFGFSLNKIKSILQKHTNIYAHLQAQHQVIKKEALRMQQVNKAIVDVLESFSPSTSPDWQYLISLIKRFDMNTEIREKLKESWAGSALSPEQFEDFLYLYEQFPEEFAKRDQYISDINQKKVGSPEGKDGEVVASFMHDLSKKLKIHFSKAVKLGSSLMKSIQSGELTQLEVTPEGADWLSRAMTSYWLKRWENIYNGILENLDTPPSGEAGEKIAKEWRGLIDDYFLAGSRDYLTGLILWQEIARQSHEQKEQEKIPTPQEMIKPWHLNILFNSEASTWISQALDCH